MTKRIGGTTYRVCAYIQQEENEKMETRLLRMVENEMNFTKNEPKIGFQNGLNCGTINVPQMSCPA